MRQTETKSAAFTGLVYRRRYDDAERDGHRSHEGRRCLIVLDTDLIPQLAGREQIEQQAALHAELMAQQAAQTARLTTLESNASLAGAGA